MTVQTAKRYGSMTDMFAPIREDLVQVDTIIREKLTSAQPGVAQLIEHLRHYRGKGLRPALLLLTARACGTISPAHRVLAAVVEMIHTATLVHDDVLDAAEVRRHNPTVNTNWGNQASILLGDYLFTHAFHLSSTLDDVRACRLIGESTNRLCAGELHQIVERGNLDLNEEAYFDIINGKTAELTACCCRLAALYCDMPDDVVERLAEFGRLLGLAFQIADDVLDLMGEERLAGKSLGTDVQQQKLTLPLIRLLANATNGVVGDVRAILNGTAKSDALRPILRHSGVLLDALRHAESLTRDARGCLDCLEPSECRDILEELTYHVVHRNM